MKKIFIIFAFLLSAFNAFADGLSANDVTLKNEETTTLDINLSNASTDIVGLQFNLSLPAGITPVMDGNDVVITPSNRLKGSYTLRGSKAADGSYLFTFLSNDRSPIDGKSGKLFSISLQNSTATDGSYMAQMTGVTTTNKGGNEQSLADASFAISVVHKYKLTYYVDGVVYKAYEYAVGAAITPEAKPTREGYTFSGWSEIPATMPAHDVNVTGSFTINKYTIKFVNEDGTLLQSSEVEYGSTPVYAGATPTKASNAQYSYTFAGWTPQIVAATANATYTATYTSTVNKYTIKFVNENGTLLQSSEVEYGVTPVYTGATPTKAATAEYSYTFAGWTPQIVAATANATYTATYTSTVNKYIVKFVNEDGTVLQSSEVEYGSTPVYLGATPTKSSNAQYSYTFAGWTPEIVAVTADATYSATYTSLVNKYTIKFVNEDGTLLQSSDVEYGVTPVYTGTTPTKVATAEYSYTFAGWTPEIVAVTTDATYTATYTSSPNQYKLTYKVDGEVYKEYTLNYGEAITPEAEPTKEGYTFSGWSEIPATMPAHDVEVNGSFEVNIYKVSYFVDEELVHQDEVAFGETFELWTYVPEDEDLTFNGWIGEMYETMPAHDISYKADITSGIAYIYDNPECVLGIYTLDGKKVEKIHQGVYVIRMKDGSTRKFIAK